MAGELVKWMGGGKLVKPASALQRCRAAIEAAQSVLGPQEQAIDRRQEKARAARERLSSIEVFDLPRICAVRGLPYVSRYVLRGGRYEYAQDIRHKQGMNAVEYEAGYAVTFPLAEEICAWCRAWGEGGIFCRRCKAWSCYGRVTGDWARCFCGSEGRIAMDETEEIGFALKR